MGHRRNNRLMFLFGRSSNKPYSLDKLKCKTVQPRVVQQLKALLPLKESLGQLVLLGFDVAVFTPAAYLRRRLQRPSMEF